jgi:hypothetical protein
VAWICTHGFKLLLHRTQTYNLETCCETLSYLGFLKPIRFIRSSYIEGHKGKAHIFGCGANCMCIVGGVLSLKDQGYRQK